jgi:hypothetical protein
VNASALTHARDVRGCVAWLRRFTRTTPGVIVLIAVTVAATCHHGGGEGRGQRRVNPAHRYDGTATPRAGAA